MGEYITLTSDELKYLLLQAIKEGFNHTAEGWNGEYIEEELED